jgi:hypothetical protein
MCTKPGPQFAVDVVQLILVGRNDVQLDRGVLAVAALTLVDALVIDGRVFLDDLDDLVLLPTLVSLITLTG